MLVFNYIYKNDYSKTHSYDRQIQIKINLYSK